MFQLSNFHAHFFFESLFLEGSREMETRRWSCAICTYSNSSRSYPNHCELCESPRQAETDSHTISVVNSSQTILDLTISNKASKEYSVDTLFDIVKSNIEVFVEEKKSARGITSYMCKFDERTFSTINLAVAYLVKNHPQLIMMYLEDDDTDIFDNAIESAGEEEKKLLESDHEFALQMALKDFEDAMDDKNYLEVQSTKCSQTERSSTIRKIIDGDNLESVNNHVIKSSIDDKEMVSDVHLQQLLNRMDRIVNSIHKLMTSVIQRHSDKSKSNSDVESRASSSNSTDQLFDVDMTSVHQRNTGIAREDILRDYQIGGVEWLLSLHANGLNGILADEMGLGKTLQVLSFLTTLNYRDRLIGPHLIVMPLSVIASWQADAERYFPNEVSLYIHHGERNSRIEAFDKWKSSIIKSKKIAKKSSSLGMVSVVLTSYDLAIRDSHLFQQIKPKNLGFAWEYIVVSFLLTCFYLC